jgi:hypothetical protein
MILKLVLRVQRGVARPEGRLRTNRVSSGHVVQRVGFFILYVALLVGVPAIARAQAQAPNGATSSPPAAPATPPPAKPEPLPWAMQLKKAVVFLTVRFQDGQNAGEAQGTAFFVFVPDKRLGENGGFTYLVTNRHMADPSVAIGHVVQVLSFSLRVNRILPQGDSGIQLTEIPLPNIQWALPVDASVDLAVAPLGLDPTKVDYLTISESTFATRDIVKARQITEGDSVMFSGFFAQFPGQRRIEPVIREGMLAMLPDENIPTTLGLPGNLYLADLHSFHGNSGSPVFVNLGGLRNGAMYLGSSYYILGVISGYMYENEDLQLQAAAAFVGHIGANSGITTIVPIDELKALLDQPELSRQRDAAVAAQAAQPSQ